MQPMRREFLNTAGAAAVFRLVGHAPKLRAAGPNDQIGMGYIGSGIRATQLMSEFQKIPGLRHIAVCDLYDGYLARAKEQLNADLFTTKDYRQLLAHKDVDAVVIATPDHWHCQMVLDALAAGKHVYIEKPMTWDIKEGRQIVAAAQKAPKLVLQVGSQGKTSALTAKARELVDSGVLGKVHMVRMSNHRNRAEGAWVYPIPPDASSRTIDWPRFLGPRPQRPFDARLFFRWRCWWEFSGGVATDLFVHLLTWLHEVMNVQAPVSVVSQGGLYRWRDGRDVPDVMESLFEYKEGFLAGMYVNLANSFPEAPANLILGTEASLVQQYNQLVLYPEPVDHDVQNYGTLGWPKAARSAYFENKGWSPQGRPLQPLPDRKSPEVIRVERGPSHTEYFILSIRNAAPSKENAIEGHYAAAAAHLANRAYRKGCRVSWDPATGRVQES